MIAKRIQRPKEDTICALQTAGASSLSGNFLASPPFVLGTAAAEQNMLADYRLKDTQYKDAEHGTPGDSEVKYISQDKNS